jgi:hypothetical protein
MDTDKAISKLDSNNFRESIAGFEQALIDVGGERRVGQVNDIFPLIHRFVPGMYCREIFMSAGSVMTTMIHKYDHFAFVLSGKARVVSESSGDEIITAPCVITTKAGTKRVLQILEDMRWCTVHLTENNGNVSTKNENNLDDIEKEVVAATYEEFLSIGGTPTINIGLKE